MSASSYITSSLNFFPFRFIRGISLENGSFAEMQLFQAANRSNNNVKHKSYYKLVLTKNTSKMNGREKQQTHSVAKKTLFDFNAQNVVHVQRNENGSSASDCSTHFLFTHRKLSVLEI